MHTKSLGQALTLSSNAPSTDGTEAWMYRYVPSDTTWLALQEMQRRSTTREQRQRHEGEPGALGGGSHPFCKSGSSHCASLFRLRGNVIKVPDAFDAASLASNGATW